MRHYCFINLPGKLLAALALLLLLAPLVGGVYLPLKQALHWYQMEEALEQCSLHTLKIPKIAVQWVKPGKEILVQGRFFDVKSIAWQSDTAIITGLFDEEEKKIEQQLGQLAKSQQQPVKTGTSVMAGMLLLPWPPAFTLTPLLAKPAHRAVAYYDGPIAHGHLCPLLKPPAPLGKWIPSGGLCHCFS